MNEFSREEELIYQFSISYRRNRLLMSECVKKETLQLLLLRGGITSPDPFDNNWSEANSPSIREDIEHRDIRGIRNIMLNERHSSKSICFSKIKS